ncbi:MAG: PhoU domain-containing protein, partial [Candidatus Sedimenticola endophacoides]
MSDNTTGRHTMRAYADELKRLHAIVLEMSERVRTQIRDAVNSLERESPDEAWLVFEAEKRVNELDTSADDQIIHIIAKRQPVARDLREILAVSKIVGDLERIGDLACRVARLTSTFYEGEHLAPSAQMRRDGKRPMIGALLHRRSVHANDKAPPASMPAGPYGNSRLT